MAKLDECKKESSIEISAVKDEAETQAPSVKERLGEVAELCADKTESPGTSWAEVAKRRRKQHLVVKAAGQDEKVTETKNEVSRTLQGILITDPRFTNRGNIMNWGIYKYV